MNKVFAGLIVAASLLSFVRSIHRRPKPAVKTAVKTMKCPYRGMTMTTTRTAAMPVAVKIKGVTYYCCSTCPAGKKAAHNSSK